ncbi:hypothetical protein U1Q18_040474 [Sarracenia purpurea var. burkii]
MESHLDEVVVLPPFCGFEGNSGLCFVGCCCLAFVGVDGSSSKPGYDKKFLEAGVEVYSKCPDYLLPGKIAAMEARINLSTKVEEVESVTEDLAAWDCWTFSYLASFGINVSFRFTCYFDWAGSLAPNALILLPIFGVFCGWLPAGSNKSCVFEVLGLLAGPTCYPLKLTGDVQLALEVDPRFLVWVIEFFDYVGAQV